MLLLAESNKDSVGFRKKYADLAYFGRELRETGAQNLKALLLAEKVRQSTPAGTRWVILWGVSKIGAPSLLSSSLTLSLLARVYLLSLSLLVLSYNNFYPRGDYPPFAYDVHSFLTFNGI